MELLFVLAFFFIFFANFLVAHESRVFLPSFDYFCNLKATKQKKRLERHFFWIFSEFAAQKTKKSKKKKEKWRPQRQKGVSPLVLFVSFFFLVRCDCFNAINEDEGINWPLCNRRNGRLTEPRRPRRSTGTLFFWYFSTKNWFHLWILFFFNPISVVGRFRFLFVFCFFFFSTEFLDLVLTKEDF